MANLGGFSREPRNTARGRRNAAKFAQQAELMFGNLLTLNSDGVLEVAFTAGNGISIVANEIAVDLGTTPGLQFTSAKLLVKTGNGLAVDSTGVVVSLGTNPGLVFTGGSLLAKVQGVVALDASGIKVTIGDGLAAVANAVTLQPDFGELWTHTTSTITVSAVSTWYDIAGINTAGELNAITQDATNAYKLTIATTGTYLVNWAVSAQGGTAGTYHLGVTVDGVAPVNKTHGIHVSLGDVAEIASSCLLALTSGDLIWLQISDNHTPAQNVDIINGNFNVIYIGP